MEPAQIQKYAIISLISLVALYVIYKAIFTKEEVKETTKPCPPQKPCPTQKACPTCPTIPPNPPNSILVYTVPGYLSITASQPTLLKTNCDDARKVVFKDAMRGGAFMLDRNDPPLQPICANMIYQSGFYVALNTTSPDFKYTRDVTDWLFYLRDGDHVLPENRYVKMIWVSVVLKNNNVYAYAKEARFKKSTASLRDLSFPITIYNLYKDAGTTTDTTNYGKTSLSMSNSVNGYGLRNVTFMIYNTIRPLVADTGYHSTETADQQRGWYDVSGTGEANHYCRAVGAGDNNTTGIWMSCLSPEQPSNSDRGVYKANFFGLPQSSNSVFYNANTIDLDTKPKMSIF